MRDYAIENFVKPWS